MRPTSIRKCSALLALIALTLAGCASQSVVSSAPPAQAAINASPTAALAYNVGKFSARFADDASEVEWMVDCSPPPGACVLAARQLAPKLEAWETKRTVASSPRNFAGGANHELTALRAKLKADPKLWETSMQRDMLKFARPLIDGDGKFIRCGDIGAGVPEMAILCEYQESSTSLPITVLLMQTMISGCSSSQVMCLVYFLPLQRQP